MVTRIRQLLEQKQLTPTQFADAIGVGRPVMSHILSERNKPSLEVVQRIIDAFPEVSMSWLLRGTGEMLESGSIPTLEAATAPAKPIEPTPTAPVVSVPIASQAESMSSESVPSAFPSPPAPAVTLETAVPATKLTSLPNETKEELATVEASLPPIVPENTPVAQLQALSSSPVEPPTPAALKPFKAQRFVPSGTLPTQAQTTTPAAPLASAAPVAPTATPVAAAVTSPGIAAPFVPAPLPVEASPATVASPATPVAAASSEAALLPFLSESGKAIRRIVIFYRDGSFADYQPEQ